MLITGANAGAIASMTPSRDRTSAAIVIGTVMRTNIQ